jgi:hypothetical protein
MITPKVRREVPSTSMKTKDDAPRKRNRPP